MLGRAAAASALPLSHARMGALVGRRGRRAGIAARRAVGGELGHLVAGRLLGVFREEGGKNHGGEVGRVAASGVTGSSSLQRLLVESGTHKKFGISCPKFVLEASIWDGTWAR